MVSLDLEASSLGSGTLGGGSSSEDSSSHATLELQIRTHGEGSCCAQHGFCSPGAVHCCMHACLVSILHNPTSHLPHCAAPMLTAHPFAAMHERAEMGEAAHAAYKGGLDAQQALQLKALTETVLQRAAAAAAAAAGGSASSGDAAAQALFRHLDQNGDGRIRWALGE